MIDESGDVDLPDSSGVDPCSSSDYLPSQSDFELSRFSGKTYIAVYPDRRLPHRHKKTVHEDKIFICSKCFAERSL